MRDEGYVDPLNRMGAELLTQSPVGNIILGHNQHTARVAIEAMHNPWTESAADTGEVINSPEEGIDESVPLVSRPRVHHHSGGLHYDHHVLVFEKNLQGDVRRFEIQGHRLWQRHLEPITGLHTIGRLRAGDPVHLDMSIVEQALHLRSRDGGD